jgi:polyketide cyclase/dehydrase/lipid transport protein
MAASAESIEISRRPEDVFTYVLDPLHYAEWDDSVISAHRDDPSPLAVGSKTTVLRRMGPLKVPAIEELVELNPPRQFTNRGVSGLVAGISKCTVEPLDGGQRSRLTIALDIEARGIGKLLLPVARRRARTSLTAQVKRLKEILDGDGTTGDVRQEPSARRDP